MAVSHRCCTKPASSSVVEASLSGVALARRRFPHLTGLEIGDIYAFEPAGRTVSVVLALDVIEHLYFPRKLVDLAFRLLSDDVFLCSTPYHGYLKNLAIALSGKFDRHVDVLWDHGHIKFFSEATLRHILLERGFQVERIHRIGRIRPLAKNMIAVARKLASSRAVPT